MRVFPDPARLTALAIAIAAAVSLGRAQPRKIVGCAASDVLHTGFRSWISTVVRANTRQAVGARRVTGLPYLPAASVTEVSDPLVCSTLAGMVAAAFVGRDTVNLRDVVALTVDSAYYVVSDWKGGPETPRVTLNADSSATLHGGQRWVDVLIVNRATGTSAKSRYILESPY